MNLIRICFFVMVLLIVGCSSFKPDSVDFSAYAQDDYAFVKIGLVWGLPDKKELTEDAFLMVEQDKGSGGCKSCRPH